MWFLEGKGQKCGRVLLGALKHTATSLFRTQEDTSLSKVWAPKRTAQTIPEVSRQMIHITPQLLLSCLYINLLYMEIIAKNSSAQFRNTQALLQPLLLLLQLDPPVLRNPNEVWAMTAFSISYNNVLLGRELLLPLPLASAFSKNEILPSKSKKGNHDQGLSEHISIFIMKH